MGISKSSVRLCDLAYVRGLFAERMYGGPTCTSALETGMNVYQTSHTFALETEVYICHPSVRPLQRVSVLASIF